MQTQNDNQCLLSIYIKVGEKHFGIFWSALLKRSKRSFIYISRTVYNDDDAEMMLKEHEAALKCDGGGKGRSY